VGSTRRGPRSRSKLARPSPSIESGTDDSSLTNGYHELISRYQRQRQLTLGDLLLENRIVFLQGEIYDGNANELVMKLLYLQSENRRKDIHFYINSPGGERRRPRWPSTTRCRSSPARSPPTASAWRPAAAPCCWRAARRANAMPCPTRQGHDASALRRRRRAVSDIEIQANEILRYREVLNKILAKHTGQPIERSPRIPIAISSWRRRGQSLRPGRRHPAEAPKGKSLNAKER
jgi:ATP-dependent Clp protease, protease subunit